MRRFSSKPSPSIDVLPNASYFSLKRPNSVQPQARRTEPYGPPYNFPTPSKYVNESNHRCTGLDSVLVVGEKPRTLRSSRRRTPITAFSRQYPQDDLVEALDEKLSALKGVQTFETDFHPRYVIASENDASTEALRGPDTLPAWCLPVKRRVVSDIRPMTR
jgi:hypothetical protein